MFGYIVETEHYRYCLRCTPSPGDYQGYLYCYDLRQQQMVQQDKPVGGLPSPAVSRRSLRTPRHSFRLSGRGATVYVSTTGFRYELLTDDPDIQKAADDILLDFAGEENPRQAC
ncbi:MAG: hypothetical protein V8Q30_03345 [Acutalibacteraceae bacterium]